MGDSETSIPHSGVAEAWWDYAARWRRKPRAAWPAPSIAPVPGSGTAALPGITPEMTSLAEVAEVNRKVEPLKTLTKASFAANVSFTFRRFGAPVGLSCVGATVPVFPARTFVAPVALPQTLVVLVPP